MSMNKWMWIDPAQLGVFKLNIVCSNLHTGIAKISQELESSNEFAVDLEGDLTFIPTTRNRVVGQSK